MTAEHTNFPVVSEGRIGDAEIQSVSARELHAFLQVGKVFGAWITERIAQYEFEDGRDFEVFSETGNNPSVAQSLEESSSTTTTP